MLSSYDSINSVKATQINKLLNKYDSQVIESIRAIFSDFSDQYIVSLLDVIVLFVSL